MNEVTQILNRIQTGDARHASAELLPLVYDELRKLAAARLRHEPSEITLQATALVHEAYLRLVNEEDDLPWDSRRHFFAAAAEAMRRILVESARRRKTLKRGGRHPDELVESEVAAPEVSADIEALDEALDELARIDPRCCEVVKMRCFAGMTREETAAALDISLRTVVRLWDYGRAWLKDRIA